MQMKTTSILLNCLKQIIMYWLNTRTLKKTIWIDRAFILSTAAPEPQLKILGCVHKSTDWHDKDSLKETFTLLNSVKKHSKQITIDLNHESNFVHSVEEYDLALNISPIDSETPNNNLQDDTLHFFYKGLKILFRTRVA